jgi:short-subunit dehydrogenase
MNKTALITGSTSGIGLELAKSFVKESYNIMSHAF